MFLDPDKVILKNIADAIGPNCFEIPCLKHWILWVYFVLKKYMYLSGGFWAGPAQSKVVKMKKNNLPTGLQVHLEDMFWV